MKRILLLFMTFTLILASASCSSNTNDIVTSDTKQSSLTETTTTKTNADETTSTINTNVNSTIFSNDIAACNNRYGFRSIEDLHTYLTTGSTNPEDYTAPTKPLGSLKYMPSAEYLQSQGYLPLLDIFDINENLFDSVEAYFQRNNNGGIHYWYYLDDIYIGVDYVGNYTSKTTSQHYAYLNGLSTNSELSEMTNVNSILVRTHGSYEVVYELTNNIKKRANILIDDFYITVDFNAYSTNSTIAHDYETFLTSEKYVAFAPLFSDNQKAFETAIATMVNGAVKE